MVGRCRATVCLLVLFGSGCAANGAWRRDLVAGAAIAGVPTAEQRHLDHDLVARLEALRAVGAVQSVERMSAGTAAKGFADGDLQDVVWFHNARWVRGIVAVPRIPGGTLGVEAEVAALGLELVRYHGRCEYGGRRPSHVYATRTPDVFVAVADDHVAFLVRTVNPYSRIEPGAREPIDWLVPSHHVPAVTLHSWQNLEPELRAADAASAADLVARHRLDEVRTDDVRQRLAELAKR